MSFLEAILGKAPRVKIGDVQVDASISEQHGFEAQVTEHPVEAGIDISDNYRVLPGVVTIEGIVTNTPISTGYPAQTLVSSIGSLIEGDDDPVKAAWATIKGYFDNAEVVTVESSLEKYESMVLTSFSANRDSKNGQSLRFSCTARKLRIVTTEETGAIDIPEPKKPAAKKEPDKKGRKPKKDAKPERRQSAAAKLLDKGTSFFGR